MRNDPGRIESYIHSDGTTKHKGGALVKLTCDSEAGSRTPEFIEFAKQLARMAYAFQCTSWNQLMLFKDDHGLDEQLEELQKSLKENIVIAQISVMSLADAKDEHTEQMTVLSTEDVAQLH